MPAAHRTNLQHGEVRFVIDDDGHACGTHEADAAGAPAGLYLLAQWVLGTYAWRWLLPVSCAREARRDVTHDARSWTRCSAWHDATGMAQLELRRTLSVEPDGATDVVTLTNLGRERLALGVELDCEPVDAAAEPGVDGTSILLAATRPGHPSVEVRLDPLAAARPDGGDWELSLAPGEQVSLHAHVRLARP